MEIFCTFTEKMTRGLSLLLIFNLFSQETLFTVAGAQKRVKTVNTNGGSIFDLGLFSIQLTKSDNFDHLDFAIAK